MSDLISRQDAIDAFGLSEKTRKYGGDHSGYNTMMLYEIQDVLESLPSAHRPTVDKEYLINLIQGAVYDGEACAKLIDLVDRPTGEWVEEDEYSDLWVCDQCGFASEYRDNYCPNCGAKMRGDSDG